MMGKGAIALWDSLALHPWHIRVNLNVKTHNRVLLWSRKQVRSGCGPRPHVPKDTMKMVRADEAPFVLVETTKART